MSVILGVSAFYHDSAAAILVDGELVAAAQEERFSRVKRDASFPTCAIAACLKQAGVSVRQIDHVVFYEKPLRKFERIVETHLKFAPRGWRVFCQSMPVWLRSKLYLSKVIRLGLGGQYNKRIIFLEHHESHAASAFFPSPFNEAAILTADGVGEWTTTSFGVGSGNKIQLQQEMVFPDSLGLLYSTFTAFCGFRVNGGEGKLMGLASYGQPVFKDLIFENVVDLKADGSFRLNQDYFNYCAGSTMASDRFDQLFGGPARIPGAKITRREENLAASIQVVAEEILLRICRHVHNLTGQKNLCLAGGVALNCVANGRLVTDGPFENVWVQPAAGDAGGAVGAALFVWHQLLEKSRTPKAFASQYLGPQEVELPTDSQPISSTLDITEFPSMRALSDAVAGLLCEGQTIGWFQGRMEFGPRALGNRSILANPFAAGMQDKLNAKVKFRESFRPFAPVVLAERASEYFDLAVESPHMLLAARVVDPAAVPEITHIDNTARIQTVTAEQNPLLYDLISAFESRTGCPVLINTSFNVRGEPIVCTESEALDCFRRTQLDALAIGTTLYRKKEAERADTGDFATKIQNQKSRRALKHRDRSNTQSILAAIQVVTFPLRWLSSWMVLMFVYFALIWPLGIVARLAGSFNKGVAQNDSYWSERPGQPSKKQYFKQF